MLGLRNGFDQGHIHGIKFLTRGQGANLGHVPVEFVPNNLFGQMSGLNERRQVYPRINPFALQKEDEVFRGDHLRGSAVSAVRAAAHAANRRIDNQLVTLV
jgi:hypothetical protein